MQLQHISTKIYEIRGLKVMLDVHLAKLYHVPTKSLNLTVKRNIKRFPEDFMFQLTKTEWKILRFQTETSKSQGGTRYIPHAFTEQGIAMLSGLLNSYIAIEVNIAIMRAFVFMRQYALTHKDLTDKLKELEARYNLQFHTAFEAIDYLMNKDQQQIDQKNRTRIGFKKQN